MEEESYLGRRLLIAVDVTAYGSRTDRAQFDVQSRLIEAMDVAAGASGLDRSTWLKQPSGDGELAVLPGNIDERTVIDDYVRECYLALVRSNYAVDPAEALTMKMAIHPGLVERASNGFSGQGVVLISRLLGSQQLRIVARSGAGPLCLIVSRSIYAEVISQGHTALKPGACREVIVEEKETRVNAWIHVPGRAISDWGGVDLSETEATGRSPGSGKGEDAGRDGESGPHVAQSNVGFNAPVFMRDARIGGIDINGR